MIRLMIGKMGSGKTACMVREIIRNEDKKTTLSNIIIKKKNANHVLITRDMVIKKETVGVSKTGKEQITLQLNDSYWKELRQRYDSVNVVLDEAHTLLNSRRAMSKENEILNEFIALLRRVVGDSNGYGELILITQLGRRLDIIARELATSVHYHKAYYKRTCSSCKHTIVEHNESYMKPKLCPRCGHHAYTKHSFIIEKFEFASVEDCEIWLTTKQKTYYTHYYITDIEQYFPYYDTFQWENMISEY